MQSVAEEGSAFVPWIGSNLDDILCEHHQRTVTADNCVSFEGKTLQIPANRYRCHYVRVRVRVHRYTDGALAVFHGPRKLADYDAQGKLKENKKGKERQRRSAARHFPSEKLLASTTSAAFPSSTKRTIHLLQNRTFLFVDNKIICVANGLLYNQLHSFVVIPLHFKDKIN